MTRINTPVQIDLLQRLMKFLAENGAKVFEYTPCLDDNAKEEFVAAVGLTYCIFTGIYGTKVLAKFQSFEDEALKALIKDSNFANDVLFADYVIDPESFINYVGAPIVLE